MKPKHDPETDLAAWIASSSPHSGTFFRSVDHKRIDSVLSGARTKQHGGRFAPVGNDAVFFSVSDWGATMEVTAGKERLGGASQMPLSGYPRIMFAVAINLNRVLDLRKVQSKPSLRQTCENCLTPDLVNSQQLGTTLIRAGIQGLLFPSVHPGGDLNLVVYFDNLDKHCTLQILNEASLLESVLRFIQARQ